ncbi:Fe-S oxidoreductase [Leucobacter tenebrionis]|uniref:Fe-S oxidoreductase n=1 Tax=Leucobacter tenebrionis TaxID=2873270 RepID=UPI001CA68728|nr:Fe-S oxidoreductase [Leucobacter tenebrionis]QZY52075.1 Fe-S oxidoreductase [Leucobacter tenebrionis]
MQLGARWRVGDAPHRGVPPLLHPVIAEQEEAHPDAGSWTLTWLEGRPRCALDDLVIVTLDTAGEPRVLPGSSGADHGAGARGTPDGIDDDDDWLL